MGLCNQLCLADWPAVVPPSVHPAVYLAWQRLSCLTLIANFAARFIHTCHAYTIGTIDLQHFIPLSVILTLPGCHKVSAKQNLLASFSHTMQLNEIKSALMMKQFKLNILIPLLDEVCVTKGYNCCFTDCIKKQKPLACIWVFLNWFSLNLVWW